MEDRYRIEIINGLNILSPKRRIIFGVLTCQRLYPNFVAFQKVTGWGDAAVLRDGISLIRQFLIRGDLFDTDEIIEIIDRIDAVTPDTNDFPNEMLCSFALDACTALNSTLNYLLDGNVNHIVDVAVYSRDSVDMFIQELLDLQPSDPNLEKKIEEHPAMKLEKDVQRELLKKLAMLDANSNVTDALMDSLFDSRAVLDVSLIV